jgi:hypothetical protein
MEQMTLTFKNGNGLFFPTAGDLKSVTYSDAYTGADDESKEEMIKAKKTEGMNFKAVDFNGKVLGAAVVEKMLKIAPHSKRSMAYEFIA